MTATPIAAVPAVVQSADDGTALSGILRHLPTDPASLVALALVIGSIVLVIVAGRSKKSGGGKEGAGS